MEADNLDQRKQYLSDLREGTGDVNLTLALPADPGSTGFRRHRTLPVPRPEAAAE